MRAIFKNEESTIMPVRFGLGEYHDPSYPSGYGLTVRWHARMFFIEALVRYTGEHSSNPKPYDIYSPFEQLVLRALDSFDDNAPVTRALETVETMCRISTWKRMREYAESRGLIENAWARWAKHGSKFGFTHKIDTVCDSIDLTSLLDEDRDIVLMIIRIEQFAPFPGSTLHESFCEFVVRTLWRRFLDEHSEVELPPNTPREIVRAAAGFVEYETNLIQIQNWMPLIETRNEARRRMLKTCETAVDIHLETVAQACEKEGLQPTPKKRTPTLHFDWLVMYQVGNLSFSEISRRTGADRGNLTKRIKELAAYLKLPLRPDSRGGRPPKHKPVDFPEISL